MTRKKLQICALLTLALMLAPMANAEMTEYVVGDAVLAGDTAGVSSVPAEDMRMSVPQTQASMPPEQTPVPAEAQTPETQAVPAGAVTLDADGTPLLNDDPSRYFVQVDLTNQVVTAYERDVYGEYSVVVRQMICSTGKKSTPSPHGTFEMGARRVRFGFFVNHDCYGQYWSQITRNIYFHSVLYSERNTDSLIKSSFNNLGKAVSHGCVRLMPQDAKWIYQNIPEGTTVTFTKAIAKDKELTKALKPERYED